MLQNKIQTCFNKNPQLRILFFFDMEGEYAEVLPALQLDGIRVVEFDGRWLYWKIELSKKLPEKIFIYFKQSPPATQEAMLHFPLMDLLKANRELRLDDVADFMDEYNLQSHQQSLVNRYKEELSKIQVQQVLKPVLNASNFDEKTVKQGLISAFLDLNKIEDWTIILVRLLTYALPEKQKNLRRFFARLLKNNLQDILNIHIRKAFDTTIHFGDEDEITELIRILKYNTITQNLDVAPADTYKELKIKDAPCFYFLNQILETGLKHNELYKTFREVLESQGKNIQAGKIISTYGYDADYAYMPNDLVWEIIKEILNNYTARADARLNFLYTQIKEPENIQNVLAFLCHVSRMNSLMKEAGDSLWDTPEEYIDRYTKKLHEIDSNYRKAVFEYHQLDLQDIPVEVGEQLTGLKQKIDKSYFDFEFKLNDGWLKVLDGINFDYKKIRCKKQFNFFENCIHPLQQKRVVIISDALRYEVASELVGELRKDDKNMSRLYHQLASIPSKTCVGMANLLPGKTYSFGEDEICIDGDKTVLVEHREKILQKQVVKSRAVNYDTIVKNDKQRNRELFKSDVVYIYHNVIDNEGHQGTERNTFNAVRTAIAELSKLVKQILGGFGVSKVIITADHGFLYNDIDFAEADKNEMKDSDIIRSDARHYITHDHHPVASGYKMSLFRTSPYQEPYYVVIPDSINRFKKQGSRYMYTHGGGSLQELIVPIIESTRKEERILRKVKPALIDKNLSIVSNSLRFRIIQETAVSDTEKGRSLVIGIYDNEQLVSKEIRLLLDKTSELPTDRAFPVSLVLTKNTTGSILKLRIMDEEDKLNPLIEENVKNNTLIGRDF